MPKSRKPRRKASRKTSRKGKKCPPGCVKKTLKRSRKQLKSSRRRVSRKASRKRRSVKRKASRKRRSVKRKASRKRRSVKRKASRKRRSVKRKASKNNFIAFKRNVKCPEGYVKGIQQDGSKYKTLCIKKSRKPKRKSRKRKSVKRKASRKRKSVKRKASRKRKSVKRKASRKRKSVKRKASRKRKSVKRKASRKRKSVKRKASRKRKSVKRKASRKRKSVKRNFGFFTQRMRDSMRRKFNRTRDRFGRTFKGKDYIASHEFLPPIKLPAYLYPIFIQKNPKFKGRKPGTENPIQFPARRGETESLFKRRVDRVIKSYDKAFHRQQYILARRGGYSGKMKDHIADYKAKQKQEVEKQARDAHQKMVRLANLQAAQKESKLRKQCEFIQKQIQRAPKGPRRAALEKDFKERCARHAKLIESNAEAAKRRRAFLASARSFKNLKQEDAARIREELNKYKRACAAKGKNFSGRKNSSGQYICDDKDGRRAKWSKIGGRWVKKNITTFTGNTTIDKKTLDSTANVQWNSVPLKEKIRRCRVGEAKLAKATQAGNTQLVKALEENMTKKYCAHWIKLGEKAPTNSGSSYF